MMYYNITDNPQKEYEITTPGEHVFYFENLSTDLTFMISVANADVKVYGLYRGYKNDSFTLSITQNHLKPHSQSAVIVKSVLHDHAKLDFTGKIRIEKNAENSIATLTNKNLLLSEGAKARTAPQLEVLPQQVQCTHSAVTSPLDQEQLNYIASRGVSEEHAIKLLVDGFEQEILQHKRNPSSQEIS